MTLRGANGATRRKAMRRTAMKRSRFRPKAKDPAAKLAWNDLKADLWQRAEGKCEVPWCSSEGHDPHHVKKRSQGGEDRLSNLVCLCRGHHDGTDLPINGGRLNVAPWSCKAVYGFVFLVFDPAFDRYVTDLIGPFPEETP